MWAPQLSNREALQAEAEHFVACVAQGRPPLTGGAMGLAVVELLEAASKSTKLRGQPVELKE
jgi:predicted dehydrogenase